MSEIFRYRDARELYPLVADVHRRYSNLRSVFVEFINFFIDKEKLTYFPQEVGFDVDAAKPQLKVRYCGFDYGFCFDMLDRRGRVRCLILPINPDENDKPKELGRFTFNDRGETDIPPPVKDGDPLQINEGRIAFAVVASFLIAPFRS